MIRLHVTVEGQTEKAFVDIVLAPYLAGFDVYADARCVLTSKDKRAAKTYRGGLISYQKAKKDIEAWMKEDQADECRFTTMFDLYALPDDFPKYQETKMFPPYPRVKTLEEAFALDLNDQRFVPYIQLHEFETLLLAAPEYLDWEYLEHDDAIANLASSIGDQNPELINDGRETAPSKRIIKEIPEYDKATSGVSVVARIGLAKLRQRCQHFHEWLCITEQLNTTKTSDF